jgi:hypothetical protein
LPWMSETMPIRTSRTAPSDCEGRLTATVSRVRLYHPTGRIENAVFT